MYSIQCVCERAYEWYKQHVRRSTARFSILFPLLAACCTPHYMLMCIRSHCLVLLYPKWNWGLELELALTAHSLLQIHKCAVFHFDIVRFQRKTKIIFELTYHFYWSVDFSNEYRQSQVTQLENIEINSMPFLGFYIHWSPYRLKWWS